MAPIVFVAVFSAEGLLRTDYSAVAMHVSALSLGERGWIQILNFVVFGTLLAMFALQQIVYHRRGNQSIVGSVILLVSALGFLLSGPFVMDPMETPRTAMTAHGLVHGILGGIVFVLMPTTCFVHYRSLKRLAGWQTFSRWTLAYGCCLAADLILFTLATKVPSLHASFLPYQGLLQRAVIIPYMAWLFLFARKSLAQMRSTKPEKPLGVGAS